VIFSGGTVDTYQLLLPVWVISAVRNFSRISGRCFLPLGVKFTFFIFFLFREHSLGILGPGSRVGGESSLVSIVLSGTDGLLTVDEHTNIIPLVN
jgi:hypothetical protein